MNLTCNDLQTDSGVWSDPLT